MNACEDSVRPSSVAIKRLLENEFSMNKMQIEDGDAKRDKR